MQAPFSHQDLELKQHFLGLARQFISEEGSLQSELAAALLYMNVADYMAEYLASGLAELSQNAVSKFYFGAISTRAPKRDSFNIGESMKYLERFSFANKSEILAELKAVNDCRKKIAHEILKTPVDQLDNIDQAVRDLADHTEKLVELVDEISPGMPPANLLSATNQTTIPSPIPKTTKKKI